MSSSSISILVRIPELQGVRIQVFIHILEQAAKGFAGGKAHLEGHSLSTLRASCENRRQRAARGDHSSGIPALRRPAR
jgi:hypothetical protein